MESIKINSMYYQIKIDKSTIRHNPNAGKTYVEIPSRQTIINIYEVVEINGIEINRN